jgi:hypothetical protein
MVPVGLIIPTAQRMICRTLKEKATKLVALGGFC